MARFTEPTQREKNDWSKFLKKLPPKTRKVAKSIDPWTLYRLVSTGQRVYILSVSDNLTFTVAVTGRFNLVAFERKVFGIERSDIVECDLPGPDEVLGSAISQEQMMDNIDSIRVEVRPDLWVMGPDGKAIRKH